MIKRKKDNLSPSPALWRKWNRMVRKYELSSLSQVLRKSLTRRWWWAMTWITRKDLACEETERSILGKEHVQRPCGTETLMYEDPEQVLGYCSTAQDQGWKAGSQIMLAWVSTRDFILLIIVYTFVRIHLSSWFFPVTLLTYFASCHCIDFKTNTKILSSWSLIIYCTIFPMKGISS